MNIDLAYGLSVKKFDDHRWIVNTPEGRNVLMSKPAAELLGILRDSLHHQDAIKKFQEQFQQKITEEEFEVLVNNTFKGFNILSSEIGTFNKKPGYLTLKVPLLNAQIAGLLAKPLSILFRPSLFWPVFIGTFILNVVAATISVQGEFPIINSLNVVLLAILVSVSMLIHELGHIAACRQFGIRHGAIGFGFYFIFPVVYADITQVWNTTKSQRILANAGGIYSELIYATTLLLIFSTTKDNTFLIAAVSVFIKTITELNPFIRYDGYWLLSDITNTPNLQKKSNDALKSVFHSFFKNSKKPKLNLCLNRVWLILYGLTNTLLLIAYFTYVLFRYSDGIIHFSYTLLLIFQKTLAMQFSSKDLPEGFLWILGLHILVIKILVGFFYMKIKKRFRKMSESAMI